MSLNAARVGACATHYSDDSSGSCILHMDLLRVAEFVCIKRVQWWRTHSCVPRPHSWGRSVPEVELGGVQIFGILHLAYGPAPHERAGIPLCGRLAEFVCI